MFPHLGDASAVESIQEVVVVQVVVAACGAPLHVRVHGDVVTPGDDLVDRPVRLREEGVGATEQFENCLLAGERSSETGCVTLGLDEDARGSGYRLANLQPPPGIGADDDVEVIASMDVAVLSEGDVLAVHLSRIAGKLFDDDVGR